MAITTLTNTEQSRAGAMACLEALRAIEKIAECDGSHISMNEWWSGEDNAVAVMLRAAGKPSGFMAGFVAAFAEHVKAEFNGCGYRLDIWKPEAAMTDEEKASSRVEFEEAAEIGNTCSPENIIRINEEAYKKASEEAKKSIGRLFTSAEDFKKGCARNVAKIIPVLVVSDDGYSFEKNTAEKIDRSIAALSETIKGGDVVFSPEIYEQWRNSLVAEAFENYRHIWADGVEMNAVIQRFMDDLAERKKVAALV